MLNSELEEKVFNLFKDFMVSVTKFDEMVAVGGTLLVGFQQGLEFIRRPPIDETSQLVKNIILANETKRVKSYIEAGCINTDDGRRSIRKLHASDLGLRDYLSKGKSILNELKCLVEDATGAMQTAMRNSPPFQDDSCAERLDEEANTDDKEEIMASRPKRSEVTDYAVLMAIIYSMVKQDYYMQEKVVSAINLKSSSGELETYCLMWSLRPFINDEVMSRAWKLIP